MGKLGERLVEAGWRSVDGQYEVVRLAAEFAGSTEWLAAGYSSPGRWIADRLDIAQRTANEWIRVGRVLSEMPLVDEALRSRELSFSKARELTRSVTAQNEADLVEIARRTPAADLGKAIAAWIARHEPDELVDERHHSSRSLTWHSEPGGMVLAQLRMPPADAGLLMSVVDTLVMRSVSEPEGGELASLAQQRHDAMVTVLGGDDGVTTEVILVPAYSETGRTVTGELQLRCAPCHRTRHERASGVACGR